MHGDADMVTAIAASLIEIEAWLTGNGATTAAAASLAPSPFICVTRCLQAVFPRVLLAVVVDAMNLALMFDNDHSGGGNGADERDANGDADGGNDDNGRSFNGCDS